MPSKITIDGVQYQPAVTIHGEDKIVRTYSAGVHMGQVVRHEGTVVELAPGSVRICRWRGPGANTLHEVARDGCDPAEGKDGREPHTRISEPSPGSVVLTQAIEILETSQEASRLVRSAGWAK